MTAALPRTADEGLAHVRRCASLPFPARQRSLALAARALPPRAFAGLHARLQAGDPDDRKTALHLAVARADVARVTAALDDPLLRARALAAARRLPVPDAALARLAGTGAPDVRRAVYGVLRRSRRTALAAALLPEVAATHGPADAAALLPACPPATVAEWIDRVPVPVGVRRSLARTAPLALAGLLVREGSDEANGGHRRRPGPLVTLIARHSTEAALLLLDRAPSRMTAEAVAVALARPDEVLRIVRDRDLTDLPIPPRPFSRATTLALRRLPPDDLVDLAAGCTAPTPYRWGAVEPWALDPLVALLPRERRVAHVRRRFALDGRRGLHVHVLRLAALEPADRSGVLAAADEEPDSWVLTVLPLPEVEDRLRDRATGPRHTQRMRAWPDLLACAQRHGDPAAWARVLRFAARAWHDRELVRTAALAQAALTPGRLLGAVPLDVLAEATAAAVQLGDSSHRTHTALGTWLHRTAARALVAGDLDRAAAVVRLLVTVPEVGPEPARPRRLRRRIPVSVAPGSLPCDAASAADLLGRLGPLRRAELLAAARLLRRALPAELDARLADLLDTAAARLRLADPATREARAADVDPLVAARVIATRRTDLVPALLDRATAEPTGRWLADVPQGAPGRWAAPDRQRWERLLAAVAADEEVPLARRAAAAARITEPDLLTPLLDADGLPVAAAALAGLAVHAAPERAVPVLAAAASLPGARGRAAVAGVARLVDRVSADRALALGRTVLLDPAAGVGARKAAARALAVVPLPDAVEHVLHTAWDDPDLHRDVRAAVAGVLLAWLHRPATGDRLAAHLAEPAVRSTLFGVRLDQRPEVSPDAFAALVRTALDHPDPAVAAAALEPCARWPTVRARTLDRVAELFAGFGAPEHLCLQVLQAAAGTQAGAGAWRRVLDGLVAIGTNDARRRLASLAATHLRLPTGHLDVLSDALDRAGLPVAAARAARRAALRALDGGVADAVRWERAVRLGAAVADDEHVYTPPGVREIAEADVVALLRRLDTLGGPAAGLAAVAVLRRVGAATGWAAPWPGLLDARRAAADPVVAEAALLVDAGPEPGWYAYNPLT